MVQYECHPISNLLLIVEATKRSYSVYTIYNSFRKLEALLYSFKWYVVYD